MVYYLGNIQTGVIPIPWRIFMSHVSDHTWNIPVNYRIPTHLNLSIFWKGYKNLPAEFALDNAVQTMKPCSIVWIYLHYWLAVDTWRSQPCLTSSMVTTTFPLVFYKALYPPINKTIKTRTQQQLLRSFCSHSISFFSFVPSVIRLWNLLPISVKTSTNILEFKKTTHYGSCLN